MTQDTATSEELGPLLDFIKERRGFDFTGYKRPSLTRRIRKRMQEIGVTTYIDYQSLLDRQPDEFSALFDTILINGTGLMRDPDAWEYLEREIVPRVAEVAGDGGIRIWSAGCATGEEAYSLAVLFASHLGDERFRDSVKVYATDADEDALRRGRQARFSLRSLTEAFGEDRAQRYFEPLDSGYVFRTDLRRSVIFGRHDLVQDPPISRIDLLACRNTLMYFNADVQRRVLANFHFSLTEGGYLFLGKSEALVTRTNLFVPVDLRRHIFQKNNRAATRRPPLPAPLPTITPARQIEASLSADAAFDSGVMAQVIVDRDMVIMLANRQARTLLGIGQAEIGRPLRDLEISYRPVDLRSPIDQVLAERRGLSITEVEYRVGGENAWFDVVIQPIERSSGVAGASLTFVEVGRFKQLREELERSERELEMASEELQSAVEELETTNEELQSTNEELETTNEELHSTNEELETMNEELQSTNEELETLNVELRQRTDELDGTNQFLSSILRSLRAGVVVLDREFAVRAWNREAEDLWGLRADEVQGEHFLNLDIGLPVDAVRAPVRTVLSGEEPQAQVEVRAVNRRGKKFSCLVTVNPLVGDGEVSGAILLMEDHEDGGRGH